jgi:hypothetical protein
MRGFCLVLFVSQPCSRHVCLTRSKRMRPRRQGQDPEMGPRLSKTSKFCCLIYCLKETQYHSVSFSVTRWMILFDVDLASIIIITRVAVARTGPPCTHNPSTDIGPLEASLAKPGTCTLLSSSLQSCGLDVATGQSRSRIMRVPVWTT